MGCINGGGLNNRLFYLKWWTAIFMLAGAGFLYREQAVSQEPSVLQSFPLKLFPLEIRGWTGEDIAIPQEIQRVAGNDDFINRVYVDNITQQFANLYIGYSRRPRTMVGHRPEVCYVGSGWSHNNSANIDIKTLSGRIIPCQIHSFRKSGFDIEQEMVVVSFYILAGRLLRDEKEFSGISWRRPYTGENAPQYVAAVQISSALEASAIKATEEMGDFVITCVSNGDKAETEKTVEMIQRK